MSWYLPKPLARVLISLWLTNSPNSWRRRIIADDPPHVQAAGTDPDRVFMVGDGVASGRGVVTHELGLPGHLARSLTAITGHATDVDFIVHPDMTVTSCVAAVSEVDLFRFDVVLLSVGHNEVLELVSVARWREGLGALLAEVQRRTSVQTQIFVLCVPTFESKTKLPRPLARVVDRHAGVLNAATVALTRAPNVTVIALADDNEFQPETRSLYQRWADDMAFTITKRLDPDRVPATSADEAARQRAVARLEAVGAGDDDVLSGITDTARRVFHAPSAAITFIGAHTQIVRAASGLELDEFPRDGTFCDVTIRRSTHLIVEDAAEDARFARYAATDGLPVVRFYAGCPITSPDGHRVGALCIMDDRPRTFSPHDLKMLRTLTELVERHLWH